MKKIINYVIDFSIIVVGFYVPLAEYLLTYNTLIFQKFRTNSEKQLGHIS